MPRFFDCFQMLEHSDTKEEGRGLSKSPRLLSPLMDREGEESGHTSQEVTPALPDYKQCALSTFAVLHVEHTTPVSAEGVAA